MPAVLSVLQNPRTIDLSSGWGFLTYSKVQQYLAILVSWIMPPDSPYLTSIWSEGVIKWTSMSAYLPLCSLAGAAAYWRARHGDSKKRIVATCAVFALVPVLNSAFYALNSSYYARWYYMPVLILCRHDGLRAGSARTPTWIAPARGIGWLMVATLAFAVVPVQDTETRELELWRAAEPRPVLRRCSPLVWAGPAGVPLSLRALAGAESRFARRHDWRPRWPLPALFSVVHIGIGKFGQWNTDSDLVEEYTNALQAERTTSPRVTGALTPTRPTITWASGWTRAACNTLAARQPPAS